MKKDIELYEAGVSFVSKGSTFEIKDMMPNISLNEDYVLQYFGIWKVMFRKVLDMKAKIVLEFGTRDGYSARLFASALNETGGVIHTIDKDDLKDPNVFDGYDNIVFRKTFVEELNWGLPVDILFIDDWHDPHHLYWELNQFAKFAKVVMVHDICQEAENRKSLAYAVEKWCFDNMAIYTNYPVNKCGLSVIEMQNSGVFYDSSYWRDWIIGKRTEKIDPRDRGADPH